MNELDFRAGVHGVMTRTDQPPPMDADLVLTAARQARKRRQNAAAGAGVAVAVAAVATTAVILPLQSGGDPARVAPGSGQSSVSAEPGTKTSKPNLQTDKTAPPGGFQYDRGALLLDALTEARPAGYSAPKDLQSEPDGSGSRFPLRGHQSSLSDRRGETEVWEYYADVPITKAGSTGRLFVDVITGDPGPSDLCQLAQTFWGMPGKCTVVEIDGKRVGVVTKSTDRDDFDQWASYRHPDGTVVHFAQAKLRLYGEGLKPLAELPYTVRELARMATDERFHLR